MTSGSGAADVRHAPIAKKPAPPTGRCAPSPACRAALLAPLALVLAGGCGDRVGTAAGVDNPLVVSDIVVLQDDSILDVRDVFLDSRDRLFVLSRFEPLVHVFGATWRTA